MKMIVSKEENDTHIHIDRHGCGDKGAKKVKLRVRVSVGVDEGGCE